MQKIPIIGENPSVDGFPKELPNWPRLKKKSKPWKTEILCHLETRKNWSCNLGEIASYEFLFESLQLREAVHSRTNIFEKHQKTACGLFGLKFGGVFLVRFMSTPKAPKKPPLTKMFGELSSRCIGLALSAIPTQQFTELPITLTLKQNNIYLEVTAEFLFS